MQRHFFTVLAIPVNKQSIPINKQPIPVNKQLTFFDAGKAVSLFTSMLSWTSHH